MTSEIHVTAERVILTAVDAGLLSLLAEADRLAHDRDALHASVAELHPDDPRHAAAWGRIADLDARWREVTRAASNVPAHTVEGARAKARAVRSEMTTILGGDPRSAWEALLWSLLDDVLSRDLLS
jgi:hypothetical protein